MIFFFLPFGIRSLDRLGTIPEKENGNIFICYRLPFFLSVSFVSFNGLLNATYYHRVIQNQQKKEVLMRIGTWNVEYGFGTRNPDRLALLKAHPADIWVLTELTAILTSRRPISIPSAPRLDLSGVREALGSPFGPDFRSYAYCLFLIQNVWSLRYSTHQEGHLPLPVLYCLGIPTLVTNLPIRLRRTGLNTGEFCAMNCHWCWGVYEQSRMTVAA